MSKLCIINTIKTKIKGNATSYVERENEIFIPKSDNFTLEQTYKIAVKKVDKINQEYLSEKFGKVVSLNTSASNGTGIKIHPSQLLIDAYEVKEGNKSIEELNPRNLEYFNGDEALFEQEQNDELKPFIEESKNIGEQIKDIDQQVQETTIKPGVSELFRTNPELSKIGTQEQYSQYLEQNPNGSVEQFKSWVEEFNNSNKKDYSLIRNIESLKEGDFIQEGSSVAKIVNIDKENQRFDFILIDNLNNVESSNYNWYKDFFKSEQHKIKKATKKNIEKFIKSEQILKAIYDKNKNVAKSSKGKRFLANFLGYNYNENKTLTEYLNNTKKINTLDVLSIIEKTDNEFKYIAKTIKDIIVNNNYEINITQNNEKEGVAGDYIDGKISMYIPTNDSQYTRVVIHELLHAISDDNVFQHKIDKLYNYVTKFLKDNNIDYGLKNNREFLAEIFSNKVFQELMAQFEYSEPNQNKKLSVLDKFLELLSSFFKIENNSVLKEAFLILEDITKYNNLNSSNKNQDVLWSKKINELSDFISQKSQQKLNRIQEVFNKNPELSKIGTVEQYASYLDTIFPDSKVKEIDNSLYISVLNQLEQENKIEKDCSGKLKAEKGLQTNFTKGGKWKLIKDLKGYPTHKEGGVDLTIGKNGVSIKNGNTEFTAKHGLVLPNNFGNPFEFEAMSKVLSQRNKHLNWVDRGLNPDKYPKISNQDGTFSTHRLAYSTGDNGEAYVYPTIIQNDKGELEQLDDNAAWEYARETKTAMRIPSVKLAEYYSQNGLIKH